MVDSKVIGAFGPAPIFAGLTGGQGVPFTGRLLCGGVTTAPQLTQGYCGGIFMGGGHLAGWGEPAFLGLSSVPPITERG